MKKNILYILIFSISIITVGCSTIKKDLSNVKECSSEHSYFVKSRECLKQKIYTSAIKDNDLKDIIFLYVDTLNQSINSKLLTDETGLGYFNTHYELALKSDSKDEIHSAYVIINNAIDRLK